MCITSGSKRANGGSDVEKMFWGWKLSNGVLVFHEYKEINKEALFSELSSNTLVLKPSVRVCTHHNHV